MRIRTLIISVLMGGMLALPASLLAHTSDERYVDGIVVDLSTAPVAPLVGEQTGFLWSFLDPETFTVLPSIATATITVVATTRESGAPQEVIYESTILPVTRGTLNWSYVFVEPGTYDVHIAFADTAGKERLTGFRRQVRALGFSADWLMLAGLGGFLAGLLATVGITRTIQKKVV